VESCDGHHPSVDPRFPAAVGLARRAAEA
jgi:hypothetical protein